jgi:hypothetical protein
MTCGVISTILHALYSDENKVISSILRAPYVDDLAVDLKVLDQIY